MSKISLEPNASGAGTFTLAAPNSNTNRTLNLPDESGILFSDGSGVPGSSVIGQLASSNMPAGSVIQAVQNTYSTRVNITSSSHQDTGLSATITPFSVNSKILVMTTQLGRVGSDGNFRNAYVRVLRNGTEIYEQLSGADTDRYYALQLGLNYLDSPSTTSPITYKTQGYSEYQGGTAQLTLQYFDSASVMTLMEIAG